MNKTIIPEGYNTIMPYVIVPDAGKFLEFAKEVFNAKEKMKVLRDGTDEMMHAEFKIGESVVMLGNSGKQWTPRPASLFIYVEDADATFEKAIAQGAVPLMPMEDKDYGRTGGVEDPFGNVWWITSVKK